MKTSVDSIKFVSTSLLFLSLASVVVAQDADLDGISDVNDNCINESNADQRDSNLDGYGNICDADLNNDYLVTISDFLILRSALNTFDADADLNGDGLVTITDFLLLRGSLNQAPGPSAFDDVFAFTAPALQQPGDLTPEIELSASTGTAVTVNWSIGGVAQVAEQINFITTRGSLSSLPDVLVPATSAMTDVNGDATLYISSITAGMALIVATIDSNGTTTNRTIEFISITPDTLDLQADNYTVSINEQTEVIAIVRDASLNLVKNMTINFILMSDITGGSVSPASAVTDSTGRASTFYTAGSVPGPANGVEIRAEVASIVPAVEDTVHLTVAGE